MRALRCRPAQRTVLHGVIGQSSEMAGTRWSVCRKPAACTLVCRACARCCCCCWRLVSAHTLDNGHACADDVMTNQLAPCQRNELPWNRVGKICFQS
jgi:hypothetical protein